MSHSPSPLRPRPIRSQVRGGARWLAIGGCVLVLWAAGKRREPKAGDPAETSRPAAKAAESAVPKVREEFRPALANRPHQVGYRREVFRFASASGEPQARQLDLWYPTLEKERRHNYKGQVGRAAEGATVEPGAHPLLIFSHGFLGGSDQSIFLTESFARAGYVVAAMNHYDALSHPRLHPLDKPGFEHPRRWSETKYRDRRDDVAALLDQLLAWNKEPGSPWQGRIAEDAIGGVGHSLGGYTLLAMAGGWPSWREPRFKALVLYSPYAQPFIAKGGEVAVPVLMQGGTLDFGITPFLPPVYRKLAGPKAFLVLKNESHFGWTNLISLGKTTTECVSGGNAELMLTHTLAWLDHYLLESDRSDVLRKGDSRLESYRFEAP